jgi:hypothetical protein
MKRTLVLPLSLFALFAADTLDAREAIAKPGLLRRTATRIKGWVQTTRALRRAGITQAKGSSRFTRGSAGGGVYTPGLRSQAAQLHREVHALRKASTRIERKGGSLSFFAGDKLLGTLKTTKLSYRDRDRVKLRVRAGTLTLAGGAAKTLSLQRAKNPRGRRARPGSLRTSIIGVETIRKPGQPTRIIKEQVVGKTVTGEHLVKVPSNRLGPGYELVESYARGRRGGRTVEAGPARAQGLWSGPLVQKALALPIPATK